MSVLEKLFKGLDPNRYYESLAAENKEAARQEFGGKYDLASLREYFTGKMKKCDLPDRLLEVILSILYDRFEKALEKNGVQGVKYGWGRFFNHNTIYVTDRFGHEYPMNYSVERGDSPEAIRSIKLWPTAAFDAFTLFVAVRDHNELIKNGYKKLRNLR
jgi:hypothetical protein